MTARLDDDGALSVTQAMSIESQTRGVTQKVEMVGDGEEEERGVDDGSDNDVYHDGDDGDDDIVSWLRPKPPMQNPLVPKFLLRLLRHYLQLMQVKWI